MSSSPLKGKRKAEAEPDTNQEQRQRNVDAPEDYSAGKRLKVDHNQGRTLSLAHLHGLLGVISFSFQECRTSGYLQKVGGCVDEWIHLLTLIGNSSRMFQHVSADPQWHSEAHNYDFIPFSFRYPERPEGFLLHDGTFEYMGREAFQKVHEKISLLKLGDGLTRLSIEGTMEYGKSHILAAFTYMLYRQGKRVVFLSLTAGQCCGILSPI